MSNTYHNLIRSISNISTTPKKKFNQETEDVYKLNIHKIVSSSNTEQKKKDKELFSKIKPIQSIGITELFRSVDRVKKFLPNIVNLVNITEEKKTEVRLFKRNEHQEFEESFKNEIKIITEKREKIKNKLSQKRDELQRIEHQISDIQLSINVIRKIRQNPIIIFKKENKKQLGQKLGINQTSTHNFDNLINNFNNNHNKDNLNDNENKRNSTFDKLLYKQGQEITKKQKQVAKIQMERNTISSDIHKLESEKEELKKKKEKLVEHLYIYYLNKLKEGTDTRNEGLSWIVKEIMSLGKKILISYFPKYLSEESINYLINQAKLKILLEGYEEEIKKLKNELVELDLLKRTKKKKIKLIQNRNISDLNTMKIKDGINLGNNTQLKKEYSDYSLKNPSNTNQNFYQNNNFKINNLNNYSIFNSTAKTSFTNLNTENNSYNTDISSNTYRNNENNIINNINNKNIDNHNYLDIKINDSNCEKLTRNRSNMNNKRSSLYSSKLLVKITTPKLNLKNINSIPDKLNITEVKEYLDSTKPKITEKNLGKIEQYFLLNQKINKTKIISRDLKRKEIKRIFDEYLKVGFGKKYKAEKERVLSALIGEDNIIAELNKHKRETKLYFEFLYGRMNTNFE